MKKISVNVSEDLYTKIKKLSLEKTIKEKKFVGMTDIITPVLEKEFEN